MKRERIEYITSLMLLSALAVIFALVLIKWVIPALLPFLIALAVASAVRRPSSFLSSWLHIPERVLRLLLSLFAVLIIFSIIGALIWQASTSLFKILNGISEDEALLNRILSVFDRELPIFEGLPDGLYDRIGEAFGSMITGALSSVATFLSTAVATVPGILLFITVTVIALIYFSLDLDRIIRFIEGILPEKIKSRVTNIKENVISLVWKYLKSYFFIMLITFTVMALGLFILRVDNLLLISLIIAALDILPVIGVGTVLIPWSLFSFFRADLFRGVGLLILFMVNAIIRQLAEPKILGKNLNLHPLLTLVFIYVGYSLFGFAGIILLPIVGVVVSVYLKKNSTAEVTEITACDTDGS